MSRRVFCDGCGKPVNLMSLPYEVEVVRGDGAPWKYDFCSMDCIVGWAKRKAEADRELE